MDRRAVLGGIAGAAALLAGPPTMAVGVGRRVRVAFVNPGRSTDAFWCMLDEVARAAADDLDIDLSTRFCERDRKRMIEAGMDAVAARPDYLILVNEHRSALPVLRAAESARVPTFMLLNGFEGAEGRAVGFPRERFRHFIGSLVPDNRGAGRIMASRLIDAARARRLDPEGEVRMLAVSGLLATPAAAHRSIGLHEAVEADGRTQLLEEVQVNWSRVEAHDRLLGLLRRWPGVNTIWCANDEMALGAMDAARELGRVPGRELLFGGLNWSADGLAALVDGSLHYSMGGHFLAGAWALAMLRDHADGFDFAATAGPAQGFAFAGLDGTGAATWRARFGGGDWSSIDFRRFRHNPDGAYDFAPLRLLEDA